MSHCYWITAYERRELSALEATTTALYLCHDSDSKDDDDDDDKGSDLDVALVLTMCTIMKYAEVYGGIEDTSIVFGCRMHIDDYNDCQCIDNFRFRKVHLKKICDSLWELSSGSQKEVGI